MPYAPKPLHLTDIHGKEIGFRAFSWMPARESESGRDGVFLALYAHNEDEDGYEDVYDREALYRAFPAGFSLLHFMPWWFDDAEGFERTRLDPDAEGYRMFTKHVQVFFRLTMQYVAERTLTQPPRASRRRAEREGFPKKNVVVVRLRRPKSHGDSEERSVEWSARWLVRGHWRAQFYPSLRTHRQVWVSPYIKGPEDKELRLRKATAFELVR